MSSPYPEAQILDAVEYYQEGMTPLKILDQLSIDGWNNTPTRQTIVNWATKHGAGIRPAVRPAHPRKEEAMQLLRTGSTVAHVSRSLDIDYSMVSHWMWIARHEPGTNAIPAVEAAKMQARRDKYLGMLRAGATRQDLTRNHGIHRATAGRWARLVAKERRGKA